MYKFRKILIMVLFTLAFGSNVFAESNFSGERLKSALFSYIRKTASLDNGQDLEIIMSKTIEDFRFEQSEVNAKFTANAKSLRGNCFVGIEFYANDLLLKRMEYPVRIKVYAEVPVANCVINKGNPVKAEDIVMEKKDVTIYKNGEVLTAKDIIGRRAIQNISRGAMITQSQLKADNAINRGEMVNIISRSGAVSVTTKGTALQDGATGSRIRVKRESDKSSGQIFEGIVEYGGNVVIAN